MSGPYWDPKAPLFNPRKKWETDQTELSLRRELPETGRGSWRDPQFAGLELRGNQKGGAWYLRHRIDGMRVRDKIGRWPLLSHKAAKDAARELGQAVATRMAVGADPLAERQNRRRKTQQRRASLTVDAALQIYAEARLASLRSGKQAEQTIRNTFAVILKTRLDDLTLKTVMHCVEEKRRTAPDMADLAVRYARPFFNWVEETGRGSALLKDVKTRPTPQRDRVLTLAEIGAIANALEAMGPSTPVLCTQLLLATAGRRGEAAAIMRSEVDLAARIWTLPPAKNKSNRVHLIPLNDYAISAIKQAMALTNGEMLFAVKDQVAFSSWGKFKKKLDQASGVCGWVFHDFRRSFATTAANAGVDPHIADRVLNHVGSGTASVVARIYNRSQFIDQRRHALDIWASVIEDAKVMATG